jgi:peptidoglycan lytic transglycosylase
MNRCVSSSLVLVAFAASADAEPLVQAAWYGNELRGHRTASGEKFSPNGMTAAHRSFAFWHLSPCR